ncbi:hypothetical protein [Paenibacillus residui]|uniref:Uncharacterized protein n=1 Tax=Paenibacillus residui TaxID=629724 RepID=A0ABW3D992_9BACL|nr:hypothetical protein [Aneurinibacillus sp. XH2]
MGSPRGNRPNRPITYQIGWRKGRIEYDPAGKGSKDHGHSGSKPGSRARIATYPAERPTLTGIAGLLWKRLPFVPLKAAEVLLWALPAVSFAMIIWLVHSLIHIGKG